MGRVYRAADRATGETVALKVLPGDGDVARFAREEFRADASSNYYEHGAGAPGRSYGPGNLLAARGDVEYKYDGRGFLVEKRVAQEQGGVPEVTRFEWNDFNLLRAVVLPDRARVEFKYDPFARRIGKRVVRDGQVVDNHHYAWDGVSMVHDAKLDVAGNPDDVRTFLFAENYQVVPLGERRGGKWVHYLNDVVGTPEIIVDDAGGVVGREERSVFGRTHLAAGSTVDTPFRAPGQWEDPETGLHYNRYRYYDPDSGRYISPDPLGLDGGFNVYSYGPNPVGWMDPMGWQHQMDVQSSPPNPGGGWNPPGPAWTPWSPGAGGPNSQAGAGTYCSGMQQTRPNCPADLNSQAGCHTEQKFAYDLMRQTPAPPPGTQYQLTGTYPPCPRCHAALRTAASKTGTKIKYQWEQPPGTMNHVTYDGKADPEFSDTPHAQAIAGAWSTLSSPRWAGASPTRSWESCAPCSNASSRRGTASRPTPPSTCATRRIGLHRSGLTTQSQSPLPRWRVSTPSGSRRDRHPTSERTRTRR